MEKSSADVTERRRPPGPVPCLGFFLLPMLLLGLDRGSASASLGGDRGTLSIVVDSPPSSWIGGAGAGPFLDGIAGAGRGRPPCPGRRACPTPSAAPEPTSTPTPGPTSTAPPPSPSPSATPTPVPESAIEILLPADGAALVEDRVRIEGTYAPTATSALVVVNGIVAITRDGRFVANEVPLEEGESPIEATLHLGGVPVVTHAIRVTSEARPPALELRATPESGVTPLSVRFEWRLGTSAPIESIAFDLDGDGAADHSTTEASGVVEHTYATAGVVEATATARRLDGATHEAVATIEALDADVVDASIRRSWDDMNAALAAGDVAAAEPFMTESARRRFGPVFERLAPNLPAIVASYGELRRRSITATVATYVVTRRIGDGTGVFFVTFEKGADGAWRLNSM